MANSFDIPLYYMASSVSGQDESNSALWLATRAGKMELSCPLWTTHRVPQEKFPRKPYNKSSIDQACSVEMARYWPHSFFTSLWTSTPSRSINTKKKKKAWPISSHLDLTLGQWPIYFRKQLYIWRIFLERSARLVFVDFTEYVLSQFYVVIKFKS